jgi:ABC-type polysaccharide/polyol phosphate export permease
VVANGAQEFVRRAVWRQGVLGAVNVLALVLAVRLVVLVAVSGGIVLTLISLRDSDVYHLGALAIYSVFVVIPIVWLAARK